MVSAASMVVDQGVATAQVSGKLGIPYTTVLDWVRRYREGGRDALEAMRGRARVSATKVKADPRHTAVIAAKKANPNAGSRRIRDVVRRFFGLGASETTVASAAATRRVGTILQHLPILHLQIMEDEFA
jgi:transposase